MKRTFLAAALAALCVVSAQAQGAVGSFSLKPMVGGTLTDIVGSDAEGTKMKVGNSMFMLTVGYNIPL